MLRSLTLLINTKNRHFLLERALEFYSSWDCEIIICDGSDKPYKAHRETRKSIKYYHLPSMTVAQKILYGINKVTTEYFCLAADDDFFIKSSFINGINFLNFNIDYIGVQGQFANFKIISNEIYFSNSYVENLNRIISDDNIAFRLLDSFQNITIHAYSIFRTFAAKKAFEVASNLTSSIHCEICLIIFPLLYGKHISMNELWCIRDTARYTDHRIPDLNNFNENPYIDFRKYIRTQEFYRYKQLFREEVELLNIKDLNPDLLFDKIFNIYIKDARTSLITIIKQYLNKYNLLYKPNKNLNKTIDQLIKSEVNWAVKQNEIKFIYESIHNKSCLEYIL